MAVIVSIGQLWGSLCFRRKDGLSVKSPENDFWAHFVGIKCSGMKLNRRAFIFYANTFNDGKTAAIPGRVFEG